jgi:putative glycosyltransferase (TIGR04372 family)
MSRLGLRMLYAVNRARDEGLWWTTKEISLRASLWIVWLCLVPVSLPLHLLGFRRLPILTQRIGHLSAEVDCFLKKIQLGQIDAAGKHFFVLAPYNKVANLCLLDYWRKHVTVVSDPALCWALNLMSRGPLMRHDIQNYVLAIGRAAEYYAVAAEWGERPALLHLRAEHQARGEKFLAEIGVPTGAWFVCVHDRDFGYSNEDDSVHSYRNTKVENLLPAIREIVARGGWCFRMGEPSTKPLTAMVGVIDYAHHALRSAELDIFLCASCRFFLGNTSGLFLVSSVFGIPSALTNQTPFAVTGFRPGDLSIPKLIKRRGNAEFMTSVEILSSPISNFRMNRFYSDSQLELIENSADEILDLVLDIFDVLKGSFQQSPADVIYQTEFIDNLSTDHYCFGTSGKISRRFMLRHPKIFNSKHLQLKITD